MKTETARRLIRVLIAEFGVSKVSAWASETFNKEAKVTKQGDIWLSNHWANEDELSLFLRNLFGGNIP
jgi:hypothetical protein